MSSAMPLPTWALALVAAALAPLLGRTIVNVLLGRARQRSRRALARAEELARASSGRT